MKKTWFIILFITFCGLLQGQTLHFQVATGFSGTMTCNSVIVIDNEYQNNSSLEIGAFCGEVCRGAALPAFEYENKQIYMLSIKGTDDGDLITFRLYDHSLGEELNYNCTTEVSYGDNLQYGTYPDWFEITFTTPAPQPQTFTLDITGYGTEDGNYYLIAPPFDDINPAEIEGMTTGDFDLFYFDQAEDLEWRNYGETPFNLASGKGYLYAHKTDVTLSFTGVPYSGNGQVHLDYVNGASFAGWNLVGNPFVQTAYITKDFYVMNPGGTEIIASTVNSINPMQGIFVVTANAAGEDITFSTTPSGGKNQVVLNVLQDRASAIDRAIVRFDGTSSLEKFMLDDSNTKLYIPLDDDDYAVVNANGENTLPVNFKAKSNGTYTISVDINNIEMDYLHLIDHLTGADIDLLQQPSYQFAADKNDYETRFMLVFRTETGVEENGQQNFCFVKGSHLYFIEDVQNAEFSLVDLNGRQVRHMTLKGNSCDLSGISEGLYIVRLAKDNDVKVQKVIIK